MKRGAEAIWIDGGSHPLEGLYRKGRSDRVAVVCHPHPLYGGSMNNKVVAVLERGFFDRGWSTVRFNFRGVGRSGGYYDEGRGERDDLLAVWERFSAGVETAALAGYSFGAWIALKACGCHRAPDRLVLVSPPVGMLDFDGLPLPAAKILLILGEADELAPPAAVRSWIKGAGGKRGSLTETLIAGADHFYGGKETQIQSSLAAFLQDPDEEAQDQLV